MFIPAAPEVQPLDLMRLEREAVVVARLFRSEPDDGGPRTEWRDGSKLYADCLDTLPFFSVAEVRDLDALRARLHASTQKAVGNGHWRLGISFHLAVLQEDLLPEEIISLAGGLALSSPTEGMVDDLPAFLQRSVALRWFAVCGQIRLHELIVQQLGDSFLVNVDRYMEVLVNRTSEPQARDSYRARLQEIAERLDWSDPEKMNFEILSLALSNRVLDLDGLRSLLISRMAEKLRVVEIKRDAQIQRLEMVVDEGVAEWLAQSARPTIEGTQPIIPIAHSEKGPAALLDPRNPYRRGLELALTIERKFGTGFVRFAARVACAYAKVLRFEVPVRILKTVREDAPWHPTVRFQRIAESTPEEVAKVLGAPAQARFMAMFALLDRTSPPPSYYGLELLNTLELGL